MPGSASGLASHWLYLGFWPSKFMIYILQQLYFHMRHQLADMCKYDFTPVGIPCGPKMATSIMQDEISTGLDSSTTYQMIKFMRDLTHFQEHTTLIALLQPDPDTFNLFDDVMLLGEGGCTLLQNILGLVSRSELQPIIPCSRRVPMLLSQSWSWSRDWIP